MYEHLRARGRPGPGGGAYTRGLMGGIFVARPGLGLRLSIMMMSEASVTLSSVEFQQKPDSKFCPGKVYTACFVPEKLQRRPVGSENGLGK